LVIVRPVKTAVVLDTIINNAKNNLICVYCAIGRSGRP